MQLTPKRVILFSILALFVALVGFLSLSLFGPSRPIVVSRQTTYLTEPLDRWGNVDYVGALRRRWSEGVTPQNNAAVLIWQALGPGDIPVERRSAFYSELRIASLSLDGDYFVPIDAATVQQEAATWMDGRPATEDKSAVEGLPPDPDLDPYTLSVGETNRTSNAYYEFTELSKEAIHAPWGAEEFPPLASWLGRNETPLRLAVEASGRPKYYSPLLVGNVGPGVSGSLISMLLPDVQHARGLSRALCYRAMLHLGEGRPQDAWGDLQAVHRLARLIGQQGWLIHQLVAIAIDQMALQADASLLHEADLSAAELGEIRAFLVQLPPPCKVALAIDKTERLMILDAIAHVARNGAGSELPEAGNLLLRSSIDWNVPLRMANEWYDKLAAALDHPTIEERQTALAAVESEIVQLSSRTRNAGAIVGALLSGSKRSKVAGQIMLSLFLPALGAAQHAEDRSVASLRLVQVAATLAIHRAEHGEYPVSLDALAAPLRAELPVDPFSEKAFLYERRGEGYVLWSVGGNLRDDRASGREFYLTVQGEPAADEQTLGSNQDDIVLRVPWASATDERQPAPDE